jgi:glycosyltransferase involved in cell wall biosynthesis
MPKKGDARPVVSFYYRKPRKLGNYSVEFIFRDVTERLKDRIIALTAVSRFESAGFFKRLYNALEAVFRQGDVNHITGDVHFIGILLKKRKTIQTILDCGQLKVSSGIRHSILKFFWFSLPVNRCAYVTAISTATKEEILKYVKCDPDKIVVIPVAISEKFIRVDKPFNKENPRLLQIGTAHNKNIERLIEAVQGIPCTLVIVGKDNETYKQKLRESGISSEYLSGLSDEEMRNQYTAADIITLPSTYEGFGMPILEAQAVGRPVLTANVTSMPEVAGDAACIVDPYLVSDIRNGLLKIINDDIYRDQLVEKGFENIKRYNPDRIALEYFELYKKISDR